MMVRASILFALCAATAGALEMGAPAALQRRRALKALVGASFAPFGAFAVSGGGKDYAEATIKGQDFSGQNLNNKDFSGADAVQASFSKAKLRGARFFKADLQGADFSDADLTSASLEGANLEGVKLTGSVAEGTAFSQTLIDAGDITGVDFTDAVIQPYVQKEICKRKDAAGTNAVTGMSTRDSLFCP